MRQQLRERIEAAAEILPNQPLPSDVEALVGELLEGLEHGEIRSAEKGSDGKWKAVPWVKRGILLGFRVGKLVDSGGASLSFVDKHTYPIRRFATGENIRIVPGGSSVRRGAYLAPGVVCMPPMYINVGAYVDGGTMVDSHALVGSCAQIGKRVHLSAAAQIGGVLEPINASPVIIEDDAMVGGNCGVYEGTIVRTRAVLAAGVILTRGTPVYDLVKERIYKGSVEAPLEIPEDAVVVPGTRAIRTGWGADQQLGIQAPMIVKYRDEKTDLATTLEAWLR
jgi:2,3,4,5-tetrahydropyridine-2-carboxylate N-succinyltransferase